MDCISAINQIIHDGATMYEKFTARARKVLQLANQEAQHLNHEYIGTEHILLALISEGTGVAANVLKNLGINLQKVRTEVEKIVQAGPHMSKMDHRPQTPRAKKVIECAIDEAHALSHKHVGTEHILLGLLSEQEGVAAQVLMNLGLRLETVREEVLNLLGLNDPTNAIRPGQDQDEMESEPPPELQNLPEPAREIVAEFDCQIDGIREEKEHAVATEAWEKAAELRDLGHKLRMLRDEFISHWPAGGR